jgi:hypothetical protein
MSRSRRLRYVSLILVSLTALIVASAGARAQAKVDISGPWVFTIQVDGKPVTAQITFKVEAGRLSGHVSSTMSGEQDFVGTVEGAAFEFGFGGDAGQIMFKGTADTATTLKGTFDNPGTGGEGPFTAKRKE